MVYLTKLLFCVPTLLPLHGVVHWSHHASYYFLLQSCIRRQPKILVSNKSAMETIVEVAREICEQKGMIHS